MDDRDKELAELKARLAAVETSASRPKRKREKLDARQSLLLYGLAAGIGVIVLLNMMGKTAGPPTDNPTPPSVTCSDAWSSEMITKSQQLGLIERMDVSTEGLIIVVNGRMFDQLSYAAKEQIAVAADCQIAGNGKHLAMIRFRRFMRGEDLANFKGVDLMDARAAYAGTCWGRAS